MKLRKLPLILPLQKTIFICFFLSLISLYSYGQACTGGPIPANQLDLRGNSEYTPEACPANDIMILAAILDTGDPCNSCTPGEIVTADLIITIEHGTNSSNRFLGVFADLEETLANGTTVSCDIARCSGAVLSQNSTANGDGIQTLDYGEITFTCGSSLSLTDILLVWTAANGECPITPQNNPNGKYCYNNGVINIDPPLTAMAEASCGIGNTGNIDLTVMGGSGSFSYAWNNGATTEDLTNVPFGTYMVTVSDNNVNDANGNPCTVTTSVTFNGPCCSFETDCPTTGTNLGTYNCTNLNDIPDCPSTVVEATMSPYNLTVGTNQCGTLEVICADNMTPNGCTTTTQNITRTITIFDDIGDGAGGAPNGMLDAGEDSQSCDFTYMVTPTALSVMCPDPVNLPACSTADQIMAAYTNWESAFSVTGGCNTSSNINMVSSLPQLICGNPINLNFTLTATDDCGMQSCNAMFNVAACPPPTADAGTDQVVCGIQNIPVSATANGSGSWSGGAGSFGNSNSATTNYIPTSGELGSAITLTWITADPDGDGPCVAISDVMTVTFNEPAEAEAGANQVVCGIQAVTLGATANGSGSWSGGAGSFDNANSMNTTYTPTSGELGSTVTLTWTTADPDGAGPCVAVSDGVMVTFNEPAIVNAGSDQTVCSDSPTVSLSGTVSGGSTNGSWSGGAGVYTPNANALTTSYMPSSGEIAAGMATLTLTTNDPNGPCPATTDEITIIINPTATANAGSDQVVCGIQDINLSATANGIGSWSGGNGTFGNPNNTTTTYMPTNGELGSTVTLTWTTADPDGAGPCSAESNDMTVTFNEPATANAGGDVVSCGLMDISIEATTQSGGTGMWALISGGGSITAPTSLSTVYVPTNSDNGQTVTLQWTTNDPDGAGPCVAVSDQMTIMFNTDAMADAGADQVVCGLNNVSIMATGGTGTWNVVSGGGSFNSPTSLSTIYMPAMIDLNNTITLEWITADPDGAGPCQEISDEMQITFNEPATATTMADQTLCGINGAITIDVAANGNGGWNIVNGNGSLANVNNSATTYTPTMADIGTTVQLEWTTNDPDGTGPCVAVSDMIELTFNTPATADAGTDQTVCGLSNISIDASNSSGAGVWSVVSGDGSVLSPNSAMTTYIPGANDLGNAITLAWTTADPDGEGPCGEVSDQVVLNFNAPATADAGDNQTLCGITNVNLDASGSNGGGMWSIVTGAGSLSNASSSMAVYQAVAADEGQTVTLQWTTADPDGEGPCVAVTDMVNITFNDDPIADAGADQIICGETTAMIDASNSSGGGLWTIVSGSGNIVASTNAMTSYIPSAGDVGNTVTLQWTTADPDGEGPCVVVSDMVNLSFETPAIVNAGDDLTACSDDATVTLDGSVGGGASSGTWTGGNGNFSPNAMTLNATYTPTAAEIAAGNITLTLTTNNPEGPCDAVTDMITITYNAVPTADAGLDQTVCGDATVTVDATNSSGGGVWSIINGNGTIVSPTSAVTAYVPNASDIGTTVTLQWTTSDPDGEGPCPSVSDQMLINYNTPAIANVGNDQVFCGLQDVSLDVGANGPGSWSGGNGTFSNVNSTNTTYTPTSSELGTTVMLTWTTADPDGEGPCNAVSDFVNITFNGESAADAGEDQRVCGTTTVDIDASNSEGTGLWNIISGSGTIIAPTNAMTSYIPSTGDIGNTVTLQWTTSDPDGEGPCPSVSDLVDLTFDVPATVGAGQDQTICSDAPTITLNGSIGGGATNATWSGGAGMFSPNANTLNATYTPSAGEIVVGSVTLVLTSNDPEGPCDAVSDMMVLTINNEVLVNAGGNQEICSDTPIVTLQGDISGGIGNGTWSGGSGTFSPNTTTLNATYTPSAAEITAGSVTLTLTSSDPNGPCNAVSDMATIVIYPLIEINAGADQTICIGETATLSATLGGEENQGTWSGGSGTFGDVNDPNTVYTPDASEVGTSVSLTWTSDDPAGPCDAISDMLTLTINDVAVANAGTDQTVCEGEVVQLMAISSGAAIGGTWSGGNGTFDDNTLANANYTPAANEMNSTIELIWTTNDPEGPCTAAMDTVLIMIGDAANANAGDDQTLCEGDVFTLQAVVSGGAMGGTWSGGTGAFSNANDPNTTYTPASSEVNTTVTLTWTTDDPPGPCNASSDEVLLTINEAATVEAGTSQTVCGAIPVSLSASLGGSATSGTWSGGAGFFADNTDPNTTYTAAPFEAGSTVTLTWTSNDPDGPCTAVADEVSITFNTLPIAIAAATLPTTCELDGIVLSATTNGTGSWSVSNGSGTFNPSNTAINATYIPALGEADTTLQFIWTTDDPDGTGPCTSVSDETTVFINELPVVNVFAIGDTVCAPDPDSLELFTGIDLDAILSGSATSGTWSGGAGSFNFPNSPTEATYIPDPSEYSTTTTLYWTTNDPDGIGPCEAAVDSVEIYIEETRIVGEIIVTNSSNCGLIGDDCDGSITFTLLSGPVPGFYEVRFIFGTTDTTAMVAGNAGPPAVVSLTELCTGGYFIVSVTPPNGCTDIINRFVTIEDPNAPPPPEPTGNTPLCLGEDIELFANIVLPPGGMYFWEGPNGFVSFAENPVIPNSTIDNIGTYTLTIRDNGCESTPGLIEVELVPNTDVFPVTLNACENPVGSGMADFNLSDANDEAIGQVGGVGNVAYYPTEADALAGTNPLPNDYTGPNTQFYISIADANGCAGVAPLNLVVDPIVDGGDVAIDRVCDGNQLYVIDSANPPNPLVNNSDLTFYWYLNGVLVGVVEGLPYFSPSEPGIYTVEVINTSTGVCTSLNSFDFPYEVGEIIDCKDCGNDE